MSSYLVGFRYLYLDQAGVPHSLPIIGVGSPNGGRNLPILQLVKGTPIVDGSPTSALIAPDGHCWAWNKNDDAEWNTVEEAIAALRKRIGKSAPKLVKPDPELEPAE
jgi:hypothetical protein